MNKNELVEAVAGRVGDRATAAAAVDAVLATVVRTVQAGERVALSGFGVFEKADRAARTARNPATGGTVQLAATSVPRFRAGQAFKDVVSGARPAPEELPAVEPRPRTRAARPAPEQAVLPPEVVTAPAPAAPQPAAQAPAARAVTAPSSGTKPKDSAGGKAKDSKAGKSGKAKDSKDSKDSKAGKDNKAGKAKDKGGSKGKKK